MLHSPNFQLQPQEFHQELRTQELDLFYHLNLRLNNHCLFHLRNKQKGWDFRPLHDHHPKPAEEKQYGRLRHHNKKIWWLSCQHKKVRNQKPICWIEESYHTITVTRRYRVIRSTSQTLKLGALTACNALAPGNRI